MTRLMLTTLQRGTKIKFLQLCSIMPGLWSACTETFSYWINLAYTWLFHVSCNRFCERKVWISVLDWNNVLLSSYEHVIIIFFFFTGKRRISLVLNSYCDCLESDWTHRNSCSRISLPPCALAVWSVQLLQGGIWGLGGNSRRTWGSSKASSSLSRGRPWKLRAADIRCDDDPYLRKP